LTPKPASSRERVLEHAGDNVREFYANLRVWARVGIEATGSMQWFLELMEELGVECQVGRVRVVTWLHNAVVLGGG
jgi:hypothetical protein